MMKKQFMSTGIFEKPFMNSRITAENMTMKEKLLGYLAGLFGTLALIAVVNQLAELYYTEVFYIVSPAQVSIFRQVRNHHCPASSESPLGSS